MSALATRAYALHRCLRLLRQRPATVLLAVLLSAAALAVPLLIGTLAQNLAPLLARSKSAPEVSVFVAAAAGVKEREVLQARLLELPGVTSVRLIPKEAALADLAQRTGLSNLLDDLKANPLPDVLVLSLKSGIGPAEVHALAEAARKLPRADSVQVDADWYRKLVAVGRAALLLGALLGGLLLGLGVLILVGAVRLLAASTREELAVLRLVGADEPFVRRPYAYLGAATLLAGALLAVLIVWFSLRAINPELAGVAQLYGAEFSLRLPGWPWLLALLAAAGLIGGLIGSAGLPRQR